MLKLRTSKHARKEALLTSAFRSALRQIADSPAGEVPSRETLVNLQAGWGNKNFVANIDYLEALAKFAAVTDGPVLECGSGLTTVILGLLAVQRGVEVWSLEHSDEWHGLVAEVVREHAILGLELCLAPLRDFGGFSWYYPPLDRMPRQFRLVICDGPPGKTPGGRYGLLPVLGERLASGALVLLDDANRRGETRALDRWKREAGVSVTMRKMPAGTFAIVTWP